MAARLAFDEPNGPYGRYCFRLLPFAPVVGDVDFVTHRFAFWSLLHRSAMLSNE